jgi:hypothetical protein
MPLQHSSHRHPTNQHLPDVVDVVHVSLTKQLPGEMKVANCDWES